MAATVWRGRLAFGMVSIPVRLFKAARRERIRFHHVYRSAEVEESEELETPATAAPAASAFHDFPGAPAEAAKPSPEPDAFTRVRNLPVAAITDEPISKPQVLKGYEIEKDRYVAFDPAELAALRPQTSTELTIAEFVHLAEIDPAFFDTSYYAAPDRGGEKPYALLFQALAETGYAAIGSLAMHGREHATVVRPGRRGLILHTLYFEKEVRADEEYRSDPALVNPKELDLAKRFVEALAAPFDASKLKDTFEERLRALIDARTAAVGPSRREEEQPAAVPPADILEALKKSLALVRRPPQTETVAAPRKAEAKPRRVRQAKG